MAGGSTVKEMTTNFGKLDKFEGHDFRRWQKRMHFLLKTLKVVYVLTTPMPELLEDDTVEAIRRRAKWENDDYICKGHTLNGMSDPLFDNYQNVESVKELWDSLESNYMIEDASSKKFLISIREAINVSINYEHKDALDARMKRIKDGVAETKHIMQSVRVLRNPNSESMHNSMFDGVSASYGESVSQPTMNPRRIKIGSNMGGDSAQSPLVSTTTPLPPHQSNVDVAAIFGVPFTTVGDLEVLIKDIDAGIHEEVLSGMTNDKRKVVIEALGAMCELIETQRASNLPNDGLIYSIDDVAALFGVPLNSPKEIDEFTKDLEVYKYALWSKLTKETRSGIIDIICNRWETLLNMQKSTPIGDDRLSDKASPSDPVVQYVNINTKSTSYAGAAGASVKDQPTTNFNFRPLVADHVFDGVNISIPCKVIEKVSTQFKHTLYGYFIGKRMAFLVVEYYARNNWAKHGLKRIIMNSKGFFLFKLDSRAGLEAVLEGGPWLIHNSLIILKKWSMDTKLLKDDLTRILIWVKLHDAPLQVFEEDGISLIATFIGKPVMLDSYTSAICNDSWGRSIFARCLIEVNSEADLVDVVTISIPSLTRDGFTKETIRVEYEWRPPRCGICKIFGHVHDHLPKKVVSPPIVTTSNVVTPTVEKTNDGFQTLGKKKKRKGKFVRYEPKATASEPKHGATNVGNASKSSSMLKSVVTSSQK
ncbi:zinc knuckle CX2CX4HX4C containing protein, partial [Tanacetum coccineum]